MPRRGARGAAACEATPLLRHMTSPSAMSPGLERAPVIGRRREGPSASSDAINLAVARQPVASTMATASRNGLFKSLLPLRPFPKDNVSVMFSPKKSRRRPNEAVFRSR